MSVTRREFIEAGAAAAVGLAMANNAASTAQAKTSAAGPFITMPAMWISAEKSTYTDTYGAFRGTFVLAKPQRVIINVLGAHWFNLLLDGAFLTQGPYRFPPSHPEYEVLHVDLPAGRHVLAATVRAEGVSTRMLQGDLIPPFFMCQAHTDNAELAVAWKMPASGRFCAIGPADQSAVRVDRVVRYAKKSGRLAFARFR